ncbi:Mrp family chromosome partitioning ATPase [Polaromonas sp. CG_9.5]|uniref:KGGVGR-motif variant AAA ATPase n=1 Tax=Polaromonas sp. CG_9.5 TaxID=3071705 RepID=UPI002DFA20D0|nr:Mrp family chromosome partitioning ATPase [Polaromonas sp. CG_9.5]
MTTFDDLLPKVADIFQPHSAEIQRISPVYVNRDLNGRVRLIVAEQWEKDPQARTTLNTITQAMFEQLGAHAFPASQAILFEANIESVKHGGFAAPLADVDGVQVIDRLATEGNWSTISPIATGVPRVVFFSIKGGVGRSTAMAATAWSLAQSGKRVLVLDLDLESPGLSSSLLPSERRPTYGITDWLVEDLVNNGDAVLRDMIATSTLSRDGDIYVVPAHGVNDLAPGFRIP